MKFFIDTGDIGEIRTAKECGLVDGVTTNPSLIAKTKRPFNDVVREILDEIPNLPVSLEVVGVDVETMMTEARNLRKLGSQVVVKIPLIPEGLKALRRCKEEGIPTNCTLCFSACQALLAAKAGATYISPFIGRLDDISSEGMQVIEDIRAIYDNYQFETKILVSSVRLPDQIRQAAIIGADVATIPFAVLMKLAHHPLTDVGLKQFLADWEKVPK